MRFLLLSGVLALSACSGPGFTGGSRYDASRNATVYRAPAINIGAPIQGGSLGAARISLAAEARCSGEGCAPTQYEVALSKDGGNAAVSDYGQISFETRDGTVSFGDDIDADGSAQFYSVAQGEFVRLSVPAHIFESFAESPTLTIRLGGSTYRLSYERRGALRQILPPTADEG